MPDALHCVPLDVFIDKHPVPEDVVARYFRGRAPQWHSDLARALRRNALTPLPCSVEGYRFVRLRCRTDTIVAIHESSGAIAGATTDFDFFVWPDHRGRGLGVELLDAAFQQGIKTMEKTSGHALSPAGLACRKAVHRRFVERALSEGLEVPDEVLKDYPDLDAAMTLMAP